MEEFFDDEFISKDELKDIRRKLLDRYTMRPRYDVFECENVKKGNERRWYVWDNLEQKRLYNGKLMTRADAKGRITREKKGNVMMYVERTDMEKKFINVDKSTVIIKSRSCGPTSVSIKYFEE